MHRLRVVAASLCGRIGVVDYVLVCLEYGSGGAGLLLDVGCLYPVSNRVKLEQFPTELAHH